MPKKPATKKGKPKTKPPVDSKASRHLPRVEESAVTATWSPKLISLRIISRLKAFWSYVVALSVVLSLLTAALIFRQDISVEPNALYNPADPFSQRFVITNEGPLSIYEVHYVCAVTYLATGNADVDKKTNSWVTVMLPMTFHTAELRRKEKNSTDCDYIARFGPELSSVRIEITVLYRRKPWLGESHVSGFKFSARKDSSGKFIWDYGSPDAGPFDDRLDKPVIVVPFAVRPAPADEGLANSIIGDSQRLIKEGHHSKKTPWIITTVISSGP